MSGSLDRRRYLRAALGRAVLFLLLWLVLYGSDPVGLLAGGVSAIGAAWVSLRLLPEGPGRIRIFALGAWIWHFLGNSLLAGIDVARRAFDPRLPLEPGFVTYRCDLPPGLRKSLFCTAASLMPGSLPAGLDDEGNIVIHCLDRSQPITAQMAAEEARLRNVLGGETLQP